MCNIATNGKCEFKDQSNSVLFYATTQRDEFRGKEAVTSVYDDKGNLLATISYYYGKLKTLKFKINEVNGNSFVINLDGNDISSDDGKILLKRTFFNKKISLYVCDKLVMQTKCTTLIRQWMQGNYKINILDDSKVNLSVYMLVIAYVVIANEYICTENNIL